MAIDHLPEASYLAAIGELAYEVNDLEWLVLGDLDRLAPRLPPGADAAALAGETTWTIGRRIEEAAGAVVDDEVRAWLEVCAGALKQVAILRNDVLHARPATAPDGEQRLRRWYPAKQKDLFITDDWLDDALAQVRRLRDDVVRFRPD